MYGMSQFTVICVYNNIHILSNNIFVQENVHLYKYKMFLQEICNLYIIKFIHYVVPDGFVLEYGYNYLYQSTFFTKHVFI